MIDVYTYIIYLLLLKFLSPHSRIVRFFYLEQILYIDPRTISENLKGLEDGVEWDGFVIDWLPSSRSALISFGESIRFLRIIIFQPWAENNKFDVLIWNKIDIIYNPAITILAINDAYKLSLSSKSICSSYFLHLAWQYGQCQYRSTINEMMNNPFGMMIDATIEYKVSS